jgi:FKBP-type peptidyl-prolyl cis-trans isomerase
MRFLGKLLVFSCLLAGSQQLFAQNDSISLVITDTIITDKGIETIFKEHGTGITASGKKYLTAHYIVKTFEGRVLRNSYKQGNAIVVSMVDNDRKQEWINTLRNLRVGDDVRITVPDSIVSKNWRAFLPTKPFKPIGLKIRLLVLSATNELPPDVVVLDDSETKIPQPFDVSGKDTLKTRNGLKYIVVKDNFEGDPTYNGRRVEIHYTGYFEDGTIFDASYIKGKPFAFTLTRNEVIDGLDEGVRLMKTGDKFRFLIPSRLGYGIRGTDNIPPDTNLIFDVELISVD